MRGPHLPRPPAPCRATLAGTVLVLSLTLGLGVPLVQPTAAGAGDAVTATPGEDDPAVATTLRPLPEDAGRIIKHPNYGHAPTHPGDRGGWQQTLVLLLVLGGVIVIGLLIWRDASRRRATVPTPRAGSPS
jgi:hypothetical protein